MQLHNQQQNNSWECTLKIILWLMIMVHHTVVSSNLNGVPNPSYQNSLIYLKLFVNVFFSQSLFLDVLLFHIKLSLYIPVVLDCSKLSNSFSKFLIFSLYAPAGSHIYLLSSSGICFSFLLSFLILYRTIFA